MEFINTFDIRERIVGVTAIVLFCALAAFSVGQDIQMDEQLKATQADRERIYCAMEGHSETYCGR